MEKENPNNPTGHMWRKRAEDGRWAEATLASPTKLWLENQIEILVELFLHDLYVQCRTNPYYIIIWYQIVCI